MMAFPLRSADNFDARRALRQLAHRQVWGVAEIDPTPIVFGRDRKQSAVIDAIARNAEQYGSSRSSVLPRCPYMHLALSRSNWEDHDRDSPLSVAHVRPPGCRRSARSGRGSPR
jgi:hypothetical protein